VLFNGTYSSSSVLCRERERERERDKSINEGFKQKLREDKISV